MEDLDINISLYQKNGQNISPFIAKNDVDKGEEQQLVFELENRESQIDDIFVTIKTAQNLLLQQHLPISCIKKGKTYWEWDGFNNNGIYDSSLLKQRPISVIFQVKSGVKQKIITKTLIARSAKRKWLDIRVDRNKKSVDVTLRLNIKDAGAKGLGKAVSRQLENNPLYKALPSGDPKKQPHLRYKSFSSLKDIVFSGIKNYWQQNIVATDGNTYSLNIESVNAKKDAMNDISIVYNTNREWLNYGSSNPIKNALPILNQFLNHKIAYNTGWVKYNNEWFYEDAADADREFSEVAAYEIGHEMLRTAGEAYHYKDLAEISHQQSLATADLPYQFNAGQFTPRAEAINYYSGDKPENLHIPTKASADDIIALLQLASLKFNTGKSI